MLNCQYCNISPSPAALSTSGIVTRERERLLVPVHPHNFNLSKGDDDLSICLLGQCLGGFGLVCMVFCGMVCMILHGLIEF